MGKQKLDLCKRRCLGKLLEYAPEIGVRLETICLRGLDQAVEIRAGLLPEVFDGLLGMDGLGGIDADQSDPLAAV